MAKSRSSGATRAGQTARAQGELWVRGRIKVVLTWNLAEDAFLKQDGSRRKFRLLRGGAEFAHYIRSLQTRIEKSSFFLPDEDSQRAAALGNRAGLLSQYLLDYEFLPTYRVRPGLQPSYVFDEKTGRALERLKRRPLDLRETLERQAWEQLSQVWEAWPTKRVRLSRYGILQVVLESPESPLVGASRFLDPLTCLHSLLGVRSLFSAAYGSPGARTHDSHLEKQLDGIERRWDLEVPVQWEIVGRILSWLIDAIDGPEAKKDLVRFDPAYRTRWRQAKAHGGGTSLPLRARFVTIYLEEVADTPTSPSPGPRKLKPELRGRLASLLEGLALVQVDDKVTLSPQSTTALEKVLRENLATWDDEVCLLSYDIALVTAMQPPGMLLLLDLKISYSDYWPLVARTFEYLNELRLLARFLEYRSSALFEQSMKDLSELRGVRQPGELSQRGSALGSLLARLRAASAPHTVVKDGTLFSKIDRLRTLFNIPGSIEHSERNLDAIQRIVSHAESQRNDRSVVSLTVGLAVFTAALMGLALPPYYHYASELMESLKSGKSLSPWPFQPLPEPAGEWAAELWGGFSLLLIFLALRTAFGHLRKLQWAGWRGSALLQLEEIRPFGRGLRSLASLAMIERARYRATTFFTRRNLRRLWWKLRVRRVRKVLVRSRLRLFKRLRAAWDRVKPVGLALGELGRTLRRRLGSYRSVPSSVSFERAAALDFVICVDGRRPAGATRVTLFHSRDRLFARFDCEGGFDAARLPSLERPIWEGESVLVLLASAGGRSARYVEIEVGPTGRLSEFVVLNPGGLRSCMAFTETWSGDRSVACVGVANDGTGWWAEVEIPLESVRTSLGLLHDRGFWRANFCRIHRPAASEAEFSAWQPTGAKPADFHRPSRFGCLSLAVSAPTKKVPRRALRPAP